MKAILIDDEKNCTDILQIQLKNNCPEIEIVAIHNNPIEGIESVRQLKPDVLFLDVEMPQANGFEVLQKLHPMSTEVIFTTAHAEYAIKAIRFSALDYLTKPIQDVELIHAVNRMKEKKSKEKLNSQFELLLSQIQQPNKSLERIALATRNGVEIVDINQILFCEAQSNYTLIYFVGNKKLLVSKTLKQIEELLKQHYFYRVHQSYLINLKYVNKYVRSGGGYVLIDGHDATISVSQSRREGLIRVLNI